MSKGKGRRAGRGAPARPLSRKVPTIGPPSHLNDVFATFLKNNPLASLATEKSKSGLSQNIIKTPWGDSSLSFLIPEDAATMADAINNLYLPSRLTAIFHIDEKKLEVIWTAYALPDHWKEVSNRKFVFNLSGTSHPCHFSASSDRLLTIARYIKSYSSSDTGFRNLLSYNFYLSDIDAVKRLFNFGAPLSFWIENIEWDESKTISILENLNFYLRYFDSQTAYIIIHNPKEPVLSSRRVRYFHGDFPREIDARSLEPNLLSFWASAVSSNPVMAFMMYYRILEYAAVHYIDRSLRDDIRKILISPTLRGKIEESIDDIVDEVLGKKSLEEIPRIKRVIRDSVKMDVLWREIKENQTFFVEVTQFDGGFEVGPLIGKGATRATFGPQGCEGVADALRNIRNVLVHGKDLATRKMLLPTSHNLELLRPWVQLIATVAGEIMVYGEVS